VCVDIIDPASQELKPSSRQAGEEWSGVVLREPRVDELYLQVQRGLHERSLDTKSLRDVNAFRHHAMGIVDESL